MSMSDSQLEALKIRVNGLYDVSWNFKVDIESGSLNKYKEISKHIDAVSNFNESMVSISRFLHDLK